MAKIYILLLSKMFKDYSSHFATVIPRIKFDSTYKSFRLPLQPSSVWRNLQMVLETKGNTNRIPQIGPPPLVVPAPFSVSLSIMMLFQTWGKL